MIIRLWWGTATSEVALNNCSFFHAFKPVKCEKRFVMNWPLKRLPAHSPPFDTQKLGETGSQKSCVLWPLESLLISTYCSKCGESHSPIDWTAPHSAAVIGRKLLRLLWFACTELPRWTLIGWAGQHGLDWTGASLTRRWIMCPLWWWRRYHL